MRVLAFAGKRQVGKTTLAKQLATVLKIKGIPCRRVGFSDPIHRICHVLLEYAGYDEVTRNRLVNGDLRDTMVVPEFGMTMREFQQNLGTDFGRNMIHDLLWVNLWQSHLRVIQTNAVVIQDSLRFENEAAAIRDAGGVICHVFKAGGAPYRGDALDAHVSESGIRMEPGDLIVEVDHSMPMEVAKDLVFTPILRALQSGGPIHAATQAVTEARARGMKPSVTLCTGEETNGY